MTCNGTGMVSFSTATTYPARKKQRLKVDDLSGLFARLADIDAGKVMGVDDRCRNIGLLVSLGVPQQVFVPTDGSQLQSASDLDVSIETFALPEESEGSACGSDLSASLEAACRSENPTRELSRLVEQASSHPEVAVRIALAIEDTGVRDASLLFVAEQYLSRGQCDEVQLILNKIADPDIADSLWVKLLPKIPLVSAFSHLSKIADAHARGEQMLELLNRLAKEGPNSRERCLSQFGPDQLADWIADDHISELREDGYDDLANYLETLLYGTDS